MASAEKGPGDVVIRRARAADADAFAEQRLRLFESLGQLAAGADLDHLRRETRATFLDALERGDAAVWLATGRGGEVRGSAALLVVPRFPSLQNPTRREGHLAHMFVDPDARRCGVGSALLRAALDEARRRKLVRLRLHATEDGRKLYDGFGFRLRSNDMEILVEPDPAG